MKIELHILQNFAPSNLNRDDTGAPKDCEFGGYRRARISSQCQKRAVRQLFELEKLVAEEELGARTKRLAIKVADTLVEAHKHNRERALALAMGAIEGVGLGRTKKGSGDDAWKTEYLLFVPQRIVRALADLLHEKQNELLPLLKTEEAPAETEGSAEKTKGKGAKKDAKKEKSENKKAYPKDVAEKVTDLLEEARNTVDVALFGRMIADKPDWNVDASCQVAHAISTNRVQMNFDFFTAVDDFKPNDNAGSDMMGTVQFNSSCFYRYAVLDVGALANNLHGDKKLLARAVHAFAKAFTTAIPTGKQNSMAAHSFPSYVLAVVRKSGPSLSLANAFLTPARPRGEEVDLVQDSMQKLEQYLGRLREVLGDATLLSWNDHELPSDPKTPQRVGLNELYQQVVTLSVGAPS